jgi:hypothetical protein
MIASAAHGRVRACVFSHRTPDLTPRIAARRQPLPVAAAADFYVFFTPAAKDYAPSLLVIVYRGRCHLTKVKAGHHGFHLHRIDPGIFRRDRGADSLLRCVDGQGRPVMNWVYWLSGLAALGIFVYLVIALFKPELFS